MFLLVERVKLNDGFLKVILPKVFVWHYPAMRLILLQKYQLIVLDFLELFVLELLLERLVSLIILQVYNLKRIKNVILKLGLEEVISSRILIMEEFVLIAMLAKIHS
jgi:hypothetical protein